jgi:hypothetical protein
LAKTQPQQLALFQTFFPDDHNDHYSNTIELYDAIPKYITNLTFPLHEFSEDACGSPQRYP